MHAATTPTPEHARADGVLPDDVIRDPRAAAWLIFLDLRPDLDQPGVTSWLQQATELVRELERTKDRNGHAVASVATAFGRSFFTGAGGPRFGLAAERSPVGLLAPPLLTKAQDQAAGNHDVLFYVMATAEAPVARFLEGLAATRPAVVAAVVERGFQRDDHRELFGFRDGLRNAQGQRPTTAFVDRDESPDEPDWADGGSYLAYLQVRQDTAAMAGKQPDEQDQIIGRRKSDGSRLDRDAGASVREEGPFAADIPSVASHVRKAGPRGPQHDDIRIFRRGVPYARLNPDGSLDEGLQFVSFQSDVDHFDVIFNRWMGNANFPTAGAGVDQLFAQNLVTVVKGGFYFVPPADDRFIGAPIFDPPRPEPKPRKNGRIVVRKRVVDQNGQPAAVDLAGITFQVLDAQTQQPIGGTFSTNSAGHATSDDVPVDKPLLLREVQAPAGVNPAADVPVTLSRHREPLLVANQLAQPTPPPYSG